MLRLVVALSVVCALVAGDDFAKKYAYSKVMSNCFGEENYMEWSKKVMGAMKECYHEESHHDYHKKGMKDQSEEDYGEQPIFVLLNAQGEGQRFKFPFRSFRQKRGAMYDAPVLKAMMKKVKAKVGNFTCVLKKMDYIDEDYNIDYDSMKREIRSIRLDSDLKEDLVMAIDHCREFVGCASKGGPMPQKIKEILGFVKCDKKARMKVCMKHDLIKYMSEFETSGLPFAEDKDEGEVAEKLLHILWGVEAKDDFQLY